MEAKSGEGAPKRKPLPSALVSNLESVLAARRPPPAEEVSTAAASAEAEAPAAEASDAPPDDGAPARPVVLLTCAGGIQSPGLAALVDALVAGGRCDVHMCAPDSDKPACGHSITVRETITATSVDFKGAKAFEISGTPVDCVSLALSGRLFPWSAPALVISGINAGPNCGYEMYALVSEMVHLLSVLYFFY
jgi:5'-nucleotidase